jgi:hypothetical protein
VSHRDVGQSSPPSICFSCCGKLICLIYWKADYDSWRFKRFKVYVLFKILNKFTFGILH